MCHLRQDPDESLRSMHADPLPDQRIGFPEGPDEGCAARGFSRSPASGIVNSVVIGRLWTI